MAVLVEHKTAVNLESVESRRALAKLASQLFRNWNLPTADQLNLLGLSDNSRSLLSKYAKGEGLLPSSRDVRDRVGWLLSIHKSLRLLYPRDREMVYGWVHLKNTAFDNYTPLEVMKAEGLIGIARVSRYLDFYRGQ